MNYYRELFKRDPKLPELFKKENALETPTGAPSSWKSAMPDDHIREIIAHTYGRVSLLDKTVGRITDTLKRLNLDMGTQLLFFLPITASI